MGSLQNLLSHTRSGDVTVSAGVDDQGALQVRRHYDYTHLLEGHRLAQESMDGPEKIVRDGKDFWRVADIPAHVLDDAIRNGALNDRGYWRNFVNNPANAAFVYERNGRKIRL